METALAKFIKAAEPPRSQEEWARIFGISRSHLNGILNGHTDPGRKLIQKISDVTEGAVPPHVWFENKGAAR